MIGMALVGFDHPYDDMGVLMFIFTFVIVNVSRYLMIVLISSICNEFRVKSSISEEF